MSEQEPYIESQLFNVSETGHEVVSKFHPEFLARGGEHVIYSVPDHPDVVIKAVAETVTRGIRFNTEHGNPPDFLSEQMKQGAEEYIKKEAARFEQLRSYFGKEHVLAQKKALVKVPVTPAILDELFDHNVPVATDEAWAVIAIQKKSQALEDPNRVSVIAGYAEKFEVDPEVYKRQTRDLVIKPNESDFNEKEFLSVQQRHGTIEMFDKIKSDEGARTVLRDFLEKAITYTSETGEILDLAGRDNVALYQKEGQWSYELLDALYPSDGDMVPQFQQVIAKLAAGQEVKDSERNILLNFVNYARTINGLAKYIGIEQRIDIVPADLKNAEIDYLVEIKQHLK
jgi:hypothetical protein